MLCSGQEGQRQRYLGGVKFTANRKWSPRIFSYQICSPQLNSNKTVKVSKFMPFPLRSDDDEVKEFCGELKTIFIAILMHDGDK